MLKRSGLLVLALLLMATGTTLRADAPPASAADAPSVEKQTAQIHAVEPALVIVEYTLKYDKGTAPTGGGFLDICPEPEVLPAWLTEADVDVFAAEFARSGFTGPLNWYRNLDRSWELMAAWRHAHVLVPALYLAGDRDLVVSFSGGPALLEGLKQVIPRLAEAKRFLQTI